MFLLVDGRFWFRIRPIITVPDPGGPETYGYGSGSGSGTLIIIRLNNSWIAVCLHGIVFLARLYASKMVVSLVVLWLDDGSL
jgi:hypothetical protein